MKAIDGKIKDYLSEPSNEVSGMTATKEQFDEFFAEYDCVIVRYPQDMKLSGVLSFYRKNDVNTIRYVYLIDFYKKPNKLHSIDYHYMKKNGMKIDKDAAAKRKEEERQKKEDELRESMMKEGCELVSKYTKASEPIYYMFEGREYKTTPSKWKAGHRAHQMKFSKYTPNYVKKCFADEGCELLTEYKNSKQVLFYKYENARYSTTFNDWIWYHNRPHLGRKKTFFTEDYEEP